MVHREELFDRESSIFVARGLYVLRYESGSNGLDHPVAVVRAAPGFESAIQILSAPGGAPGRLDEPGAALFVRASEHGSLQIGVKRRRSNGSLDAALKLESVGGLATSEKQDAERGGNLDEQDRTPAPRFAATTTSEDPTEVLFVAHLSRRGDIAVGPNVWAAGPQAPARIEGLEMRPLPTAGVEPEIQVLSAGRGASWSNWIRPGDFAGSRGRNLPLVGLRLRLTGGEAHRYIVNADALFLGSAIMSSRGREIEFVSVAGRDPLVGFRFEICPERRVTLRQVASSPRRDAAPRVRVFRAEASR
jgi:hypothetical protein